MDEQSTDWRQQFAEEARAERPDLALLCLLVGTEADPSLGQVGIDTAQIELDRLAGMVPYGVTGARAWATALGELLGVQHDFRGGAADYQRLESSLLHEVLAPEQLADPVALAAAIKALPLVLARPRPVAEAISTAGGIRGDALDANGMLVAAPGVFCAGEMLDWEAPTGGYLLTACFASGRAAGLGMLDWLGNRRR